MNAHHISLFYYASIHVWTETQVSMAEGKRVCALCCEDTEQRGAPGNHIVRGWIEAPIQGPMTSGGD